MSDLRSEGLQPGQGQVAWSGLQIDWAFQPYGGPRGGDRFLVSERGGVVWFALADAAGHGEPGAEVWDRHGEVLAAAWNELLGSPGATGDLARCADVLDDALHGSGDTVCLTLGCWRPDGELRFATWGYGVHVLPRSAGSAWWTADPAALFGLKLGWVGAAARRATQRGLVANVLPAVDRLCLLSDGLLEDDHRDPEGTLAYLEALGQRTAELPGPDALATLLEGAPNPPEDDVTAIVLRRRAS